jgi:hypothetical protein
MAPFRLAGWKRARAEDEKSRFWLVTSGRPEPVKERSRHRVTVANRGRWTSAAADAVSQIQYLSEAHSCLIFGSLSPYLAIMAPEKLHKQSPVNKNFDLLRRPPGGCIIIIKTTASFRTVDPILWARDPDPPRAIIPVEYEMRVR